MLNKAPAADPDLERELAAALADVERTFTAYKKAVTRYERCSLPSSKNAAAAGLRKAKAGYEQASERRDRLVERRRAR
jgi:hypothetical protein